MREVARALRVTEGETVGRGLAPAVGNGSTQPFLVYPKKFLPVFPGKDKIRIFCGGGKPPPYTYREQKPLDSDTL